MATTTPNFGWAVPTSTDLVKDGAVAIETLGDAIDASLVDLKGGTTGQVLAKATNTDMDFSWVAQDDSNAIQNAIVDAKGDLIAASANDTPARLAVGNNGETLVANSSTSTGLSYQANWAAGKNKIINGDFYVNQRSFNSSTSDYLFTFDRFGFYRVGGSATISAQTFTLGTAPVAGYEGKNFFRCAATGSSGSFDRSQLYQFIESVRTFAGQTVTVSFWAKSTSGTPKLGLGIEQAFGTGGSSGVAAPGNTFTLSTSWVRYSATVAIPSISGKTVGTNDYLAINFIYSAGSGLDSFYGTTVGVQTATIDIWGVQVEAGSVATAFQTATGTIQGELAACQRYYWRNTTGTTYGIVGTGMSYAATNSYIVLQPPVTMRTLPASVDFGNLRVTDLVNYGLAVTAVTLSATESDASMMKVQADHATGATAYRPAYLAANNNTAAFIGLSAEL